MAKKNPILRGFNPDPSIIRVGADYYIATSTFEWFPGVQIHHSIDLINWTLIAHPLNRIEQLNMLGVPDSCGVWAPCLSYDNETFYLVYSNVKSFDGIWKDTPNYLVTTKDIRGDWSDPIFLNSSGFDGSLFHDNNGSKWYTSMLVDYRNNKFFGGIILQEYNSNAQKLVGPVHHIFEGSEIGITEGPHIYQRNGYYHLITAEGGTEYGHAVSMARSTTITGPYELHPDNPITTSKDHPSWPLQKAGHADIVETPMGETYLVCLASRPLDTSRRCILGRETILRKMEWKADNWLYPANGHRCPPLELEVPLAQNQEDQFQNITDDFDDSILNIHYQSLRIPISEDWCSLTKRPGFLRLTGRDSLSSFQRQSMIARRLQHFAVEAETAVDFQPNNFQQMAGIVCYYNTYHFHYLNITKNADSEERLLQIVTCDKHNFTFYPTYEVKIPVEGMVYLKLELHYTTLHFFYKLNQTDWIPIGPKLDSTILSDDYVQYFHDQYRPAFTGAFIGLCCQDMTGESIPADFDYFNYKEIEML